MSTAFVAPRAGRGCWIGDGVVRMSGRVEPLFFIVTQSQNQRPRVPCSFCGILRYWAKAQKHPTIPGCFVSACSKCRLKLIAKRQRASARKSR